MDTYAINGAALLPPDENMELSFEDIDDDASGRDESGVMHRVVVRQKVGKWGFRYSYLSAQEFAYMVSILPQSGTFAFTRPSLTQPGTWETTNAYLSGYSFLWQGPVSGICRELKFNIIEV